LVHRVDVDVDDRADVGLREGVTLRGDRDEVDELRRSALRDSAVEGLEIEVIDLVLEGSQRIRAAVADDGAVHSRSAAVVAEEVEYVAGIRLNR